MSNTLWCVTCVLCVFGVTAQATTLGRVEDANVVSLEGRPAICLSEHSNTALSVGWVILSQSYAENTGVWGLKLQEGARPLVMKAGECLSHGSMPEGYEPLVTIADSEHPLVLQANQTYVFRLQDANRPADTYKVVFCVNQTSTGEVQYLQYTRRSDGSRQVPVCDGKRKAALSHTAGTGVVAP